MHEMEFVIAIVGIVWPMLTTMVALYLYFSSRNKIRLALIESGRDASIFKTRKKVDRYRSLKNGIAAFMAGVGIFIGNMIHAIFGMNQEVAIFSCLLIFMGAGLVGFYSYMTKQGIEHEAAEMV